MSNLDFLIDKDNNKSPKDGMEYIYDLDMVWKDGEYDSISVESGFIVNNVSKKENGGYSFNIKGKEGVYHCNYGWAFLENTPDNIVLISEYKYKNHEFQKIKKERNLYYNRIKKLK